MPTLRSDLTSVPNARRKTNWKAAAEHGGVWEYLPDTDFTGAPQALCTNARHWGSKHHYSVSAAVTDKGSVLVQFRKMEGSAAAAA